VPRRETAPTPFERNGGLGDRVLERPARRDDADELFVQVDDAVVLAGEVILDRPRVACHCH
jgi:hypothetical protein